MTLRRAIAPAAALAALAVAAAATPAVIPLTLPSGTVLQTEVMVKDPDRQMGLMFRPSLARDHVFSELGGLTVEQALEKGIDPREVWRAVCEAYDVPPARR